MQTLTADDCGFGYRDSVFKRETELRLIVNVTLALPRRWAPVIGYADVENELRDRNIAQPRRATFSMRSSRFDVASCLIPPRWETPAAFSRIR